MFPEKNLIALLMCLLAWTGGGLLFAPAAHAGKKSQTNAAASDKGKTQAAETAAATEKTAVVDINAASKEELMKIPGVGTRYSDEIIKGRPYKTKRDLLSRKIIPASVYKAIADKIVARKK